METIARELERRLTRMFFERILPLIRILRLEFTDFDASATIVSQLVQTSTDIDQLSRLNPLDYPWL